MHTSSRRYILVFFLLIAVVLAGCGNRSLTSQPPPVTVSPVVAVAPTSTAHAFVTAVPSVDQPTVAPPAAATTIVVQTVGAGIAIDPRVFGTNLPAWLGPERLNDATFRARAIASGSTLMRLPGGSWSNSYDWLGCENDDGETCYWTWAARPTDFLNFLRATNLAGSWTVSANGTPEEAAALVAFFNGDVNDERPIGTDARGRDWQTIGHWAQLRSDNGNPDPLPIMLWEVGNEIYGGKADVGPECAPWGWEDVWTCDGTEYINGADQHAGYLAFRTAMQAVDPTIAVGAVGVAQPDSWSNWGNKVMLGAGDALDFYVIHNYAFEAATADSAAILAQPQALWPAMMDANRAAFATNLAGKDAPVAVTEYNLFAVQEQDTRQMMTRAVNALFLADSLGQMIQHGVAIANQWNFANGTAENGTDYGMVDADSFAPHPQYYVLPLWSRFGTEMLPVDSPLAAVDTLSVYAGRAADGTLTLLAINKTGTPITTDVALDGASGPWQASAAVVQADAPGATSVMVNGVSDPDDLSSAPPTDLGLITAPFSHTFAPFSITLIRLQASSS